jgi:predicted enzyme related to lactoylglutathione lyase
MVGFFTQDLDALEARILSAGGTVVQAIGPLQMGERPARFALYADPEGYVLEVIER